MHDRRDGSGRAARDAARRRAGNTTLVVLAIGLAAPAPAAAQPALDPGTAYALDLQRLVLQSGFWGDETLVRGGVELDPGYFCGDCAAIFAGSPAALDAAGTVRALRLAGVPLYAVGLAALVADMIGLAVDESYFLDLENGVFYGLLFGGTIVGLTGGVLMGGSRAYLNEAVNRYNDDLFAAARQGRPLGVSFSLAPRPGGVALGLSGTF